MDNICEFVFICMSTVASNKNIKTLKVSLGIYFYCANYHTENLVTELDEYYEDESSRSSHEASYSLSSLLLMILSYQQIY